MRTFILAVTGLAFGVTACSSDGTSVVIVQKTPVASVSLVLPAPSLLAGQKERATATPRDANGAPLTDRPVTWQSSSSAIASVTDSGMISAVAPGSATISATSEGVSAQASMSVVDPAPAPVASVSVALGASSLNPGQTTQAIATTRDASNNVLTGRVITWSSSNAGIATVSSSGLVTAIAIGSAQITATSEGQSGNSTLTVTSAPPVPVASVTVALAASSRNPGQTTQATATTRDANNNVLTGRSISWSSSNSSIATVSGSGLVTAVAVGTAQITATSEGQSGSATLTIASPPPVPVASVSVALAASSLNTGQTTQATATTLDANNNVLTGRVITWSSSNTGVATVSTSGLVRAIAVGTAQIIASCEGQTGNAMVTITLAPVASVSVALGTSLLSPGLTTQATATTRDANNNVLTGRAIAWSSSDTTIATVSATGMVTAVAIGNALITATSEGQSGGALLGVQASSHEPPGMTLLSDRPFNAMNELGWDDLDEQPSLPGGAIITDATAPHSPSKILRTTLPAGMTGSTGTFSGNHTVNAGTLYVSYWARLSANWVGGGGIAKQFYAYTNHASMYLNLNGTGNGPFDVEIAGQDILAGGAGYGDPVNPNWTPNLAPAIVARGVWYHVEVLLTGNTAGAANGSLNWWLNGVHVGSYAGIKWDTAASTWAFLHYTNLWNGNTLPITMNLDFDHIYLSIK
jgi:uncharacterized protein YjdB